MFPNKWISKYGPINYPSRLSDLTVFDFWGKIKGLIYHERSTTRDNIIRRISESDENEFDPCVLRKFFEISCFQNKVDACIAENDAHFEHLVA